MTSVLFVRTMWCIFINITGVNWSAGSRHLNGWFRCSVPGVQILLKSTQHETKWLTCQVKGLLRLKMRVIFRILSGGWVITSLAAFQDTERWLFTIYYFCWTRIKSHSKYFCLKLCPWPSAFFFYEVGTVHVHLFRQLHINILIFDTYSAVICLIGTNIESHAT